MRSAADQIGYGSEWDARLQFHPCINRYTQPAGFIKGHLQGIGLTRDNVKYTLVDHSLQCFFQDGHTAGFGFMQPELDLVCAVRDLLTFTVGKHPLAAHGLSCLDYVFTQMI